MILLTKSRFLASGLLFCLSIFFITSCSYSGADQTGQTRNLEPFTGIKVGGAFEVVLNQGGGHQALIEADEDVINKVSTEVKGSVLHIDMDWGWPWNHDEVKVYVEFDELNSIVSSGASEVTAETSINTDDIEIKVSGAGDMSLEIHAQNTEIYISGAGDVDISGDTKMQKVRISGSGDYDAQHLKSKYTNAKISGAGNAVVFASDEIEANVSGAGSIEYYGNPQQKSINSSGAGSINGH